MSRRNLIIEIAVAVLLGLVLAAFAYFLHREAGGLIPQHNTYFGADTDRVVANLIDARSDFSRSIVHPLYGLLCIPFELLTARGLSLGMAFGGLAMANGFIFAIAIYTAIRCWGGEKPVAVAAVLFAASLGSFVYWAGVPETHFLAGVTTLAVIILARLTPRDPVQRILHSSLSFALGFSLVLTNVVIWAMSLIPFDVRTPGPLITEARRRVAAWACGALGGLGLVALAMAIIDFFIRNPTQGRLLHVFGETKFISHGASNALGGVNALGVLGANLPGFWVADLILIALVLLSLAKLDRRVWFVALFALFGPLLHSVYARKEAFIFAPDYVPSAVVALALVASAWRPKTSAAAFTVLAAILAVVNLYGYRRELALIAPVSSPPATFAGPAKSLDRSDPYARIIIPGVPNYRP